MKRTRTFIGAATATLAMCATGGLAAAAQAKPDRDPRIVGGHQANPAEWPFIAAVYFDGEQGCGGTVISPTAVLTAGHCAHRTRPGELSVSTGRSVLSDKGSGQTIGVSDYSIHRGYLRNGRADLAVLHLERPTSAPAAALSTPDIDGAITAPSSVLDVAGWGATTPKGRDPGSDRLLETSESVRQTRRCKRVYRRDFRNKEQICALGARIGSRQDSSSCFGDSGGPLVANTSEGRKLVGVVSYGGDRCGDPRFPSVYARVAPQLGWIAGQIG